MSLPVITAVERIRRLRKRLEAARAHRDASPVDLLRIQLLLLKAQRRIAEALSHAMPQPALIPVPARAGRTVREHDTRLA